MLLSAQSHAPGFQAALSELYEIYWYPLYAYARRLGRAPEETQEQIQVFLGTCLSIRRRDAPTAEGQERILASSNSMWRWCLRRLTARCRTPSIDRRVMNFAKP